MIKNNKLGVAIVTVVLLITFTLGGLATSKVFAQNQTRLGVLINLLDYLGQPVNEVTNALGGLIHNIQESFDEGIAVDGVEVIDGDGNVNLSGTLAVAGTLDVTGVTQVGIIQDGNACLATTTSAASETLLEQDLIDNSCFLVSGENDGMTLVFPATNTMTTLLATVGESRTWKFHFATSSTATLTFTEGAGMDFIGPSANDDVIDETETAVIECTRYYSTGALTDITCIIEEHGTVD